MSNPTSDNNKRIAKNTLLLYFQMLFFVVVYGGLWGDAYSKDVEISENIMSEEQYNKFLWISSRVNEKIITCLTCLCFPLIHIKYVLRVGIKSIVSKRSHPANLAKTALVRQPYSVAVLSTGGRLHPLPFWKGRGLGSGLRTPSSQEGDRGVEKCYSA